MTHESLLQSLAPDLNPVGVEASLRLRRMTPRLLGIEAMVAEVDSARRRERARPGYLRDLAETLGLGPEYVRWEGRR